MQNSGVSTFTALVAAIVAYLIGFAHAVTGRHYRDWKAAAADAKKQRKGFYYGILRLAKYGAIIVLLAVVLVWSLIRGAGDEPPGPTPAPSKATPAKQR
jgi:hypothetical protein